MTVEHLHGVLRICSGA